MNDGTKSAAGEIAKLDALYDELRKAKKGTDEYKKAKDAIVKQYGGYLDKLSAERGKVLDVADAYELLKEKVEAAAKARAMKTYIDKQLEDSGDQRGELIDELREELGKKYHGANIDKMVDRYVGMANRNDPRLEPELNKYHREYRGRIQGEDIYWNQALYIVQKIQAQNKKEKEAFKEAERRFNMSWSDALANADGGQSAPTNGGNNGGGNNGGGNTG